MFVFYVFQPLRKLSIGSMSEVEFFDLFQHHPPYNKKILVPQKY